MKAYEALWEEYDKLTDSSADKKRMKEVLGSLKKAPNKTRSTRKAKKAPATKKDVADNDASTISKNYSEYM